MEVLLYRFKKPREHLLGLLELAGHAQAGEGDQLPEVGGDVAGAARGVGGRQEQPVEVRARHVHGGAVELELVRRLGHPIHEDSGCGGAVSEAESVSERAFVGRSSTHVAGTARFRFGARGDAHGTRCRSGALSRSRLRAAQTSVLRGSLGTHEPTPARPRPPTLPTAAHPHTHRR